MKINEGKIIPNQITEIHPGVFHTILTQPRLGFVESLIEDEDGFVLMIGHRFGGHRWSRYPSFPLLGGEALGHEAWVRHVTVDIIITTSEFSKIIKEMRRGHFVKFAKMPPDFFDPSKIVGGEFYKILHGLGWQWEAIVPGNDFAEFFSPQKPVVEIAIRRNLEGV